MINETRVGIVTQFNDTPNDFYTSLDGQLAHAGDVRRAWELPFATFMLHSVVNDDCFRARIWECSVQFTFYALTSLEVGTLLKQCIDHFDNKQITISNHGGARLVDPRVVQDPTPTSDEENASWQAAIDFDLRLEKTS